MVISVAMKSTKTTYYTAHKLHKAKEVPLVTCLHMQGGHGTGETLNLVLTFSRQGKHREF